MVGSRSSSNRSVIVIVLATGALAIAILVVAVLVYARFRRDIRAAQARLQSGGTQVVETYCGSIEYATFGEGYPVPVEHGIFGGFDQDLVIARGNVGEEFHSVVPLALVIEYVEDNVDSGTMERIRKEAMESLLGE